MQKISRRLAREMINSEVDGKIFSVVFIKKNGERRKMICRKGVKKHLRGGNLKYNPIAYGYLPVFDTEKQEYRMINMNSIVELKMHHNEFSVI